MKKYIVWTNNSSEGWTPTDYDTLEQAVRHQSYGCDTIITMEVKYKIVEGG